MSETKTAAQPQNSYSVAPWADLLRQIADEAIDHGLAKKAPPWINPDDYPRPLAEPRGVFVTLRDQDAALRGCIGYIEGQEPLVVGVAECAYGAAFRDPRLPPVSAEERPSLTTKISVLTPLEPIAFCDEADLVDQLRPGIDGILLETHGHRGTLLPAVWDQIPDASDFWQAVKQKAGLPGGALPPETRVLRYRTEDFG